jgi:tight adherence protein B
LTEVIFIALVGMTTVILVLLIFSFLSKTPGKEARDRMEQYLVETELASAELELEEVIHAEAEEESEGADLDADDWLKESRKGGAINYKKILANMGKILTPKGMAFTLTEKLRAADVPLKANEFVAVQFLAVMLALIFCLGVLKNLAIGVVLGVLVYTGPLLWLGILRKKRAALFNSQILDTLMMIANGLKAGYSFLQALDMVARESPDPMSKELKQVIKENSLGINLEESLIDLNKRVASEDWDLVTTVVLIQRQVGGNLAEILEKIGATIRQRMRIKGDIQTKTAQAKVSGLMVGLLPLGIATMIYLINPEFMSRLFTFKRGWFKGWYVVLAGIIWEIIGLYAIMVIVDIEV